MHDAAPVDYVAKLAELRARKRLESAPVATSGLAPKTQPARDDIPTRETNRASSVSAAAFRLDDLYDSITIWEVYKRLLPDKPHKPYHPINEISAACPHESGTNSLSMWINDAKGLYFCAHAWEGNNKMALYCEIRGLPNRRELFHKLKQMMVWEFRREDPYAMVEQ